MSLPLWEASAVRHSDPNAKALLAARTARSTSPASPSLIYKEHTKLSKRGAVEIVQQLQSKGEKVTWQMTSSVAGFTVGNVLPLAASTNSLSIKS
jgi:hypothetical protein